jgi:hypothetical protein
MATRRKLDRRRDDLCAVALRERARSFFDSDRAAVLNVWARLVIGFMTQHIVELPHINHFSASTFVEMPFLRFAQLIEVSGVHSREGALAASPGYAAVSSVSRDPVFKKWFNSFSHACMNL